MQNVYEINLDLKQKLMQNINFVQNDIDTSVLKITITDRGMVVDITDQIVSFAFLKPDNNLVIQNSSNGVSILDASKGQIQCILTSQSLSAVGVVKCEISFSDASGKKLSTTTFNFNVTASIDNGDGILSSNEIVVIDQLLLDIQSQYNEDYVVWDSEINNKLAEATNKINETEVARLSAIDAKNNAYIATTNAINATENAIVAYNTTITIPKDPVATYSQIVSVYPNPVIGWEVVTLDTGNKYRYDGVSAWIENGNVNRGGILVGSVEPSDHSILFIDLNS